MEIVEIKMQQHMLTGSVTIDTSATPIDPVNADSREFGDEFDYEFDYEFGE